MKLFFTKPGLQTLIQDLGRLKYGAFGVPVSGAMDRSSAKIANWLVGNDIANPVLEITFMGPQIEIIGSGQIALTGANISPCLNGMPIPMYKTIAVTQTSTLSFGRIQSGCRAYLSVGGTWHITPWLGSVSAMVNGVSSAIPQSFIQKGSQIEVEISSPIFPREIPRKLIPTFSSHPTIHILTGPEFELLSLEEVAWFFGQTYRISSDSNRMGYRLEGSKIPPNDEREIISSGIVPGTIQLTKSGQPVILLADAQTSGGYYRIANITSAHQDVLAQLKPGDYVRFQLVTLDEAYEAENIKMKSLEFLNQSD